jgi:hypothetical protein
MFTTAAFCYRLLSYFLKHFRNFVRSFFNRLEQVPTSTLSGLGQA